ncbi:MAG: hypothetical protein AAFV25_18045, partial [Bacteroidota bacterium]
MQASKLVQVLQVLKPEEMGRLERFLQSSYFADVKHRAKVLALFALLRQQHPTFEEAQMQKSRFVKQLYPEQPLVQKLDKLMSLLFRQIRRFIVVEGLFEDSTEADALLLEARFYRQRQLEKHFQQSIQRLRQVQQSSQPKNKEHLLNDFLINEELSTFESFFNKRQKESLNLPATIQSLDLFYVFARLEYSCGLLSQHRFSAPLNTVMELGISPLLGQQIENDPLYDLPVIQSYYHAYRLLAEGKDSDIYFKLKHIIEQYEHEIPFGQLQSLQAVCRSFCAHCYNQGDEFYLQEGFQLYRSHLEGGYLYRQDGLLPSIIKNIVTIGLSLKEYDWIYAFLVAHKDKIVGTQFPQEVHRFNLANYYFAIKDYNTALDHLGDKYEDTYYRLAAR